MLQFTPTSSIPALPSAAQDSEGTAERSGPITVWGLSAQQLHDAYWRRCGVQCVRQGESREGAAIDRTADFYLLLEAGQCVLFDLKSLIERLVWHGAAITRIKVTEPLPAVYDERIICDERGFVQRIERCYPKTAGASLAIGSFGARRVFITDHPSIAAKWLAATTPREGWVKIRRKFRGRGRIDRVRAPGKSLRLSTRRDEAGLLDALVERWTDPNRVVEGIEEVAPGVWQLERDRDRDHEPTCLVGPLWLGCGQPFEVSETHGERESPHLRNGHNGVASEHGPPNSDVCIVGPAWLKDDAEALSVAKRLRGRNLASVRDMIDIEMAEAHPRPSQRRPKSLYLLAKRSLDVSASALLLVAAAPLMAIIALAIVINDGRPIMFRHKRQTLGGRVFDCLKFRTMCRDAERAAPDLKTLNVCDGPQVYIRNDPRVTRVGRILRLLHLDELPQLWNVLIGDMSLVGPRPSPDNENQYCPAWRELRLSVRPGITGLWQLKRTRSPGQDFQEWIRYDIEYVRNAGFWFDIRILVSTAAILLLGLRRNSPGGDEQESSS